MDVRRGVLLVLAVAGAVAGCGALGSPDEFAEALAEAECAQLARCSLGEYEATYSSDEDCLSERAEAIDEDNGELDDRDCTWLADEARACVRRVDGLTCEEWVSGRARAACDLVWACDDPRFTTVTEDR